MKKHKGFTIIEVVLVLAIAGLIFAATFIALPSLWASQRDSARKENIMTFVTNLKNYQTNNNRGALPGTGSNPDKCLTPEAKAGSQTDQQKIDGGYVVGVDGECIAEDRSSRTANELSWAGLYRDYMTDSFDDPEGYRYDLYIANCEDTNAGIPALKAGEWCNNQAFKELVGEKNLNFGGKGWLDYTLYVAVGASCDGDTAVKSLNSRKVAVVYKMERTGQFCYSS